MTYWQLIAYTEGDAQWVSKRWADHRAGNGNWQYLLWDVLMFESWRESVDL